MGPLDEVLRFLSKGCGAVGLASVLLARLAGARLIICTDMNMMRLKMAKNFGAYEVLDMSSDVYLSPEQCAERISTLTGPQGLQIAIECSGQVAATEKGMSLSARNGRYLFVGTWAGVGTVPISPFEVVHKALKIVGTTYASPENYHLAARIVQANYTKFPLVDCVTHRYRLDQVQDGAETVSSGKAFKIVIDPQEVE